LNSNQKIIAAILITAVVCIAGTFAAVGNNHSDSNKITLNIGGSSTVQPLMVSFQETFEDISGIRMNVSSGGSSVGASSTINGTFNIGMLSRDLKESETSGGLVQYTIGKDAVSIIINSSVTGVGSLTLEQIAKIYNGEITNWNEVGGNSMSIAVFAREEGSGTRECFDGMMSKTVSGWTMKTQVSLFPSTGGVTTAVSTTSGGIGYVSLSAAESASPDKIKIVMVDGVMPSEVTVLDGTYAIQRNLVLATKGEATGSASVLIEWILGPEGQRIVEEEGFVPLSA
jgi:phosphate transport system substrate-binding protein